MLKNIEYCEVTEPCNQLIYLAIHCNGLMPELHYCNYNSNLFPSADSIEFWISNLYMLNDILRDFSNNAMFFGTKLFYHRKGPMSEEIIYKYFTVMAGISDFEKYILYHKVMFENKDCFIIDIDFRSFAAKHITPLKYAWKIANITYPVVDNICKKILDIIISDNNTL